MKKEIKEIKWNDKNYPKLLKNIKNPPQKLYVMGNENILNDNCFSIIGSRSCTENGMKTAKQYAKQLVKLGLCISSGMAKGIDTAGHIGALEGGGKTIAVLGGGFSHIYPEENRLLFEKIIEQGAVITEYEPKQEPCGKQFIARNRIISGIAIGTLVVEAHYRSGTAITAKLALEQRRKLFSIPNQVDNKYGVGTNNLIRKGAILTRYVEDIIKEFPFLKSKPICEENKAINIPTEYQDICKILSTETIHINEISKKLKLDSNQTSAKLMMMELDGYVEKMPGNFFKMKE